MHVDTAVSPHAVIAHPRHTRYQPLIKTPVEARALLLYVCVDCWCAAAAPTYCLFAEAQRQLTHIQPALLIYVRINQLMKAACGTGAAMAMAPPQCAAVPRGMAGRALLSSVSASDAPASAAMGDPPPPSAADAHWREHEAGLEFRVSTF